MDAHMRIAQLHTCRCTPPMTCEKHVVNEPRPTPKLKTIGQAVPEIRKRGVHVQTSRDNTFLPGAGNDLSEFFLLKIPSFVLRPEVFSVETTR